MSPEGQSVLGSRWIPHHCSSLTLSLGPGLVTEVPRFPPAPPCSPEPHQHHDHRRARLLPGDVADKLLVVHHDTQLAGPGRKHVQRLREQREWLPRGCSQDDGSPPSLGHAILTSLCREGQRRTQSAGTLTRWSEGWGPWHLTLGSS